MAHRGLSRLRRAVFRRAVSGRDRDGRGESAGVGSAGYEGHRRSTAAGKTCPPLSVTPLVCGENKEAIGFAALTVHAVTVPTFVHDGLTLWYKESGVGAPVIFIAGTMGDHTQWGTVVLQLKGLRSITP